ncbi:MAG: Asr1405/Asl0597 family protein [Cyanobacteria bacterium J06626_23]
MLKIDCVDRWQAYFRLCELDIPCRCSSHQPLQVEVSTPQSAIQTWSVMMQVSKPKAELATWLDTCWRFAS